MLVSSSNTDIFCEGNNEATKPSAIVSIYFSFETNEV